MQVQSNIGSPRCQSISAIGRAHGFSLVEVLVAIVVLSFGLLGMVGMQAFALQSNREAKLQGQAAVFARELAEMMRGNMQVSMSATASNNPYLGTFAVGALTPSTASYCLTAASTAACASNEAVAQSEMTDWLNRVNQALPGARVSVCLDAAPYDSNGLPQWTCTATGADQIIVIKMGWTRSSTNREETGDAAFLRAADDANGPQVIFPVTSGNSTSGT